MKNSGKSVILKVVSVKGNCEYGHRKGHVYHEPFIGLCPYALHSLWPYIVAIKFNAKVPWAKKGKIKVCCPNPDDLVVFELRA